MSSDQWRTTISEKRAERAMELATLALLIDANAADNAEASIEDAETVLVAAENFVAKKYGEFR
jgi:hypothetical protein